MKVVSQDVDQVCRRFAEGLLLGLSAYELREFVTGMEPGDEAPRLRVLKGGKAK